VAERYDRARPTYPAQLIDELLAGKHPRVLDVGCGTGKVARLFRARGCEVLGVEPDARMAEVAQSHGIEVEIAKFETWDPRSRRFDLVVSGQAWHWVDPSVAPGKAAAVLPPEGRLAVFWNVPRHDAQTRVALDAVYLRFAPALARESVPLGTMPSDHAADIAAIAATQLFTTCEVRTYGWTRRYSREEWLDQLGTHSDHLTLPRPQLAALLEGVGAAIDQLGGSITVHYETRLISAQRRA
jgi:SAM-dependent methyltransferase